MRHSSTVEAAASAARSTAASGRPSPLRPFVTLSWAQSIDGSIAAAPGRRTILSGPESMKMTHALRSQHEGILVGIGTLLADDPSLGVRLVEGRSPRPIVLDAELRTPTDSKALGDRGRKPIIFGATSPDRRESFDAASRNLEASRRLEAAGASVILVERASEGGLDLDQVLAALYGEGIKTLMVEGGARILASFFAARLVDRIVVTIAPIILGGLAPFATESAPAGELRNRWLPCSLAESKTEIFGSDIVISGRPQWPSAPPT